MEEIIIKQTKVHIWLEMAHKMATHSNLLLHVMLQDKDYGPMMIMELKKKRKTIACLETFLTLLIRQLKIKKMNGKRRKDLLKKRKKKKRRELNVKKKNVLIKKKEKLKSKKRKGFRVKRELSRIRRSLTNSMG